MSVLHRHRIIPGHIGGTYDPSNVVLLTIDQHAEAHRLLFEEHGRQADKIAWLFLSNQITNQEALAMALRPWQGKKFSAAHRANISKGMGDKRTLTPEHRLKISMALKGNKNPLGCKILGKVLSDSHREKISTSLMGNRRRSINPQAKDSTSGKFTVTCAQPQ